MESFERVRIKNFRRLADVNFELPPLTVLIGANGIGKSTFLDALYLMARAARGQLLDAMSEAGGIDQNLTFQLTSLTRSPSIELGVNQGSLSYDLSLKPAGHAYQIAQESLLENRGQPQPFIHIDSTGSRIRYFDKGLIEPTWQHDPLETSLSQVPRMFAGPESLRQSLASASYYHVLDVAPRSPVRLPQQMRPALLPGSNGEDLVACLYSLRETNSGVYERIIDTLQVVFPGFQRLDFPPVAAGTMSMTWRDRRFAHPFYANQLSEGTIRFVWLTTLLLNPNLTAITLIDEPEVSLHPEMLRVLADLLRDAALRSRVVVATHSDRLIGFLNPHEVAIVDSDEDGLAHLTPADSIDLSSWLDEYSLGEVWQKGLIGARA